MDQDMRALERAASLGDEVAMTRLEAARSPARTTTMRTSKEIKDALEWRWNAEEPDRYKKSTAQSEAQEEVTYAKVMARLGKPPEPGWTEQDDPRLLAYLEVMQSEVRVAARRIDELTGYSAGESIDMEALQVAAQHLYGVVETYQARARKKPTQKDAQNLSLPLAAPQKVNGSHEDRPF